MFRTLKFALVAALTFSAVAPAPVSAITPGQRIMLWAKKVKTYLAPVVSRPATFTLPPLNVTGDSTTSGVGGSGTGIAGAGYLSAGNDYPNQLRGLAAASGGGTTNLSCPLSFGGSSKNYLCNNAIPGYRTALDANQMQGAGTFSTFAGWASGTTLHVTSAPTRGTIYAGSNAANAGFNPIYVGTAASAPLGAINYVTTTQSPDYATYILYGSVTATGSAGSPATFTTGTDSNNASLAAQLSRNQVFSGGINDGQGNAWTDTAKANMATSVSYLTGGAYYAFLLPWGQDDQVLGRNGSANNKGYAREMLALYGGRVIDFQNYARDYLAGSVGGPDYYSAWTNGSVPLSMRNIGSKDQAWNDAAVINTSGAPSAAYVSNALGQVAWDSTGKTNIYIKSAAAGTDGWQVNDAKHLNNRGYALVAQMVGDYEMAASGNGPPWVPYQEFLTPLDAAAAATVGTLVYRATTAPTGFVITNNDGSQQTLYAVNASGVITRTGAGTPVAGALPYAVWATNSKGTLRSPLDIYTGRGSADPYVNKLTISSPGIAIAGREGSGVDTSALSGAFLVKLSDVTVGNMLFVISSQVAGNVQMNTYNGSGQIQLVGHDASNALLFNVQTGINCVTNNAWTWVLFSISTGASPTAQIYCNGTSKFSGATGGVVNGVMPVAQSGINFLSQAGPYEYNTGVNNIIGGFAFGMITENVIDWSVAGTRAQLFDGSFNPVARTPFSTVGGFTPLWECAGGKGDILYGCVNPTNNKTLLFPSFQARTLLN